MCLQILLPDVQWAPAPVRKLMKTAVVMLIAMMIKRVVMAVAVLLMAVALTVVGIRVGMAAECAAFFHQSDQMKNPTVVMLIAMVITRAAMAVMVVVVMLMAVIVLMAMATAVGMVVVCAAFLHQSGQNNRQCLLWL